MDSRNQKFKRFHSFTQEEKDGLLLAASKLSGHEKDVFDVIEEGANLEAVDKDGNTALTLAMQHNLEKTVKVLISASIKLSTAPEEEKLLFKQLALSNSDKSEAVIAELGKRYTYLNCAKHLGMTFAAKAFASDTTATVSSGMSFIFNKAARSFLPLFSEKSEDDMKVEVSTTKRKREENNNNNINTNNNNNTNDKNEGLISKKSKKF